MICKQWHQADRSYLQSSVICHPTSMRSLVFFQKTLEKCKARCKKNEVFGHCDIETESGAEEILTRFHNIVRISQNPMGVLT